MIPIPKGYPITTRERIGRAIIKKITENTINGYDKYGNPFVPYSTAYVASWAFKITGKGQRVTLRMTGEMLSDLSLLDNKDGILTFGFESMEQAAKAHGHITGGGRNGSLPVRDFLGLPDDHLMTILNSFPKPQKAKEFETFAKNVEAKLLGMPQKETKPKKEKEPTKKKKDGLDEWFERVQKEQEAIQKEKTEAQKKEEKKEVIETKGYQMPGIDLIAWIKEDTYFDYTKKKPSEEDLLKYKVKAKEMSKTSMWGINIYDFYKSLNLSYQDFWDCTNFFLDNDNASVSPVQEPIAFLEGTAKGLWIPNSWEVKNKEGYNFLMRRIATISFAF